MPDDHAVVDDACGALVAALDLDRGPVLTVSLAEGLSAADVVVFAEHLAALAGPLCWRALHVGSDVVAAGVGRAIDIAAVDDIATVIAAAAGRRCFVAMPFAPTATSTSTTWRRHRGRVAVVPRLWLHHAAGRTTLGVDLGTDDAVGRREAQGLLLALRRARVAPPGGALTVVDRGVEPDERGHAAAVGDALAQMDRPGLDKVVLARRRRLRLAGRVGDVGDVGDVVLDLWRQLPTAGPDEVRYLVDDGGDALVGVTPERLCRRRGRRLEVDVLAGTGPPGHDGLLDDDKERREHEAVRRFIIDALGPVTTHLAAPTSPRLRRLRGLQHLFTPVSATLVEDAPVFSRLHPTPAVAGVPRDTAMALIADLEGFDRGLYAGVVGLADAGGEDLQVALRCAHVRVDADGADVDLYAGSGIVPGSVALREWHELDRKEGTMRAVVDAVVAARAREVARGAA